MNRIKKTIIIFLGLFVSGVVAQEGKVKRANEDFENYAFMDAIASYEDLVEEGYSDMEIFIKLGNANYVNARYENAADWYGKLVKLENVTIDPEYYFRYAQSLKSIGDYKGSDFWMEKFHSEKSDDQRARNFAEQENYLERIKKNSGRYTLGNLAVNSAVSDFAPSFYGDKLVFSTARDTGITSRNIHKWNEGSFLNLAATKILEDGSLGEPEKFTKNINTKTHESSSVFTRDGNTIYFTRNNSKEGRFLRDGRGVSRLKIYKSVFENGEWKKAKELPFNSDDYSVAHPGLSKDEKTLYFSSDMPGSLGASDIFKVSINEDGSYGAPKNLGNTINTEARESFPFVSDNVLYFSSDGHPGLGGLDVFAARIDGSSNKVINLGGPLNSRQDDFSYVIDTSGKGYFASNREGGQGSDDIYSFTQNTPLQFECISPVKGIVKGRETGNPLREVKVIVTSGKDIITEIYTDSEGAFNLEVDCNRDYYSLSVNKEGYLSHVAPLNLEMGKPVELVLELHKAKPPEAVAGTDLIRHLQLSPIYFDLDESNIGLNAQKTLNKVVTYLRDYPNANISIESHTDSKASSSYNQRLSDKRAAATRDYLISNGISASRIISKGFGKQKLVNDCKVWTKCSPTENEQNRRSEIFIVE